MQEFQDRIVLEAPSPDAGMRPLDPPTSPPPPTYGGPAERWFGEGGLSRWSAPVAPPVPCRIARQSTLLLEGARAQSVYIVQAGDFKVCRTAEDGYEQVIDFAGAGDALGLDGLATGHYVGTVEALQDAIVYAIPASDLRALRTANPTFDQHLTETLSAQWGRMRDMAWLMGAMGADRRTARFLLQLSRAMAERGLSRSRLRLPMSRRDIAAHLGLAHESISRAMTSLAASGYLRVYGREVEIIDTAGLEALAANTRGHAGECAPPAPHRPHRPRQPRHAADALTAH